MKIFFISLFVLTFFLSFSSAEIEARFPGDQPLIVPGAPGNGAAPTPSITFEDITTIDSFSVNTSPQVIIQLPTTGAPPSQTAFGFDSGTGIIGGERDIILTAIEGGSSLVFNAGANNGAFSIGTPNDARGSTLVQYDGIDGSSTLDTLVGLNGEDLTFSGNAIGFRIVALSDVNTEFTINVYDSNGISSSETITVPGGSILQSYFIDFEDFNGSVNFRSINAIEFEVEAFANVDFELESFTTYGQVPVDLPTTCINGVVLPCDTDYYRFETFENVEIGNYFTISYEAVGEAEHFSTTTGRFYIVDSDFTNLQEELASNVNVIDTLGGLPGPNNYDYRCEGSCDVEIVWSQLKNTTYYMAIEGHGTGNLVYQICYEYRSVDIFELTDAVSQPVFFDRRPTVPPAHNVLYYSYYSLDIPESLFSEGSYLVVNVSRAEPFPGVGLRVMYESLPEDAVDTGILGSMDFNSNGQRVDDSVFDWCVDMTGEDRPPYDHPSSSDPRQDCSCFTESQLFGDGPSFQLTCQLVVDPCHFRYGRWYMSVELPERLEPGNPIDLSGESNYTITATVVQPTIVELSRNVTIKGFVEPQAASHYKIDIPSNSIVPNESHLMVHLSNVRNGIVDIFVHKGLGIGENLAGGPDACAPANATCTTCDACNVVIEKCHFETGSWYISVNIHYDDESDSFSVYDMDRLPVTYTLRANWLEDPTPSRLVAGVPVSKYIGEALYDFYVIDVPPTIDTWLFVELYAKANDTEVVLAILHNEIPGGECYARPDFYCMTGDPSGSRWNSGTPAFLDNEPVQRESCSFMIQTCELTPGPLYLSVYGHHTDYAAYGDTTFYQVPVHYTLWADFDVALALQSGVSYSESVFEKQYQHYYIRADRVEQGSSLSVEVTNIRHGVPQSIEAFVNYNYLAGNCPCYDHLYNCTGAVPCMSENALADIDSVWTCCTIEVPASDFRPGVWYVSVLGVNEDYFSYTTPIGYTLTVTIRDAPQFIPLIPGQVYQGEVPQWNKTLEYANFRIGSAPIPLNDLVLKLTYVQNCEFMGKHDDTRDSLMLFVNRDAPATQNLGGWVHKCKVDTTTDSYCTIVVPHCEWYGDNWFVAVQGTYSADFIGRFTLRTSVEEVRDKQLTDGISQYDRVSAGRYKHYFIETTAEEDEYLAIDLYTNQDQDVVTAYLMKDQRAGDSPCFQHSSMCETQSCCTWQLHACDLEPGRYYISVYGHYGQFYDTSVEYTLTASMKPVSTLLFNGDPFTGHLKQIGDVNHYKFNVADNVRDGSYLSFEIDNVKHGAVTVYGQHGFLAGRCPCFVWEYTCTASSDPSGPSDRDWCEIRVPSCQLEHGEYFFSVWAIELQSPDPPVFSTPIGYTVEANLIAPIIIDPFVARGRDEANVEPFQFVANQRYNHYEFSVDDDDFVDGYHIIVEITSVRDGSLNVYYNQYLPGDSDNNCHIADLCTGGVAAGTECHWQIPYCLTKPLEDEGKHYITIEGVTGRLQASYNILIYKRGVPSFIQNDGFTLDNGNDNGPVGSRLDITHFKENEPNGWTQFMRLDNVPARLDNGRGELLEIFFYRITNNPGEPLSFNVYLHPNEPAGAHDCCEPDHETIGSCQGAPCSHTADTTTSSNNGPNVFTHTCSLGVGVGVDENNDALFGERCTVRVWPCEFNKYCGDEITDWFMSVVPIAPTDILSEGNGLQYSVQWRVTDTRLVEAQVVGSIDLTEFINTYDYSTTFSVISSSTESEGWLSFYVDYSNRDETSRLSIQTLFTQGSGTVYIQGDDFASATESCHMYMCSSNEDCDGLDRFYVSECCSAKYDRYYITLRNTGSVDSVTSVRFRIVETPISVPIEIFDHPGEGFQYTATSGPSVYSPTITGVEGDSYDYYILTIDDDDLDRYQSWVVDIERPPVDTGVLNAFIRFGAAPGQYGPDNAQTYFGDSDEGCHGWQYSCTMGPGERCYWQIPPCDLIEGHWWIAIQNPNFNFDLTPSDLPDYTLTTYITNPPLEIALNDQVTSNALADPAFLQHFMVNITADEIDFDDREEYTGYWVKFLRFQLDQVSTGTATMYVQYGRLAGENGEYSPCLSNFESVTCTGSCFIDVLPCGRELDLEPKLLTGSYFISVSHDENTQYSVSARVYRNQYELIELSETIVGTGNREGTVNDYYTHSSTQTELAANGDGEGNYRYIVDIFGEDDDDMIDNQYVVMNFTTNAFTQNNGVIDIEVFRDDCSRYECQLTGPSSWCTIDAVELAPCSAKAGRYFIRVENPGAEFFTIDFYRNETTIQTIQHQQLITEIVYPYEYQEYYYEAVNVGEGSTLSIDVCSICGDIEAFIRPDLPAGPSPDISGASSSCSMDYCRVTGDDDTTFEQSNNCCTLFLDTCQFEQRGYYIGVRGVSTTYPDVDLNEHLYLPAKYNIKPTQTIINITHINPSCVNTVSYYDSWNTVPQQFAVDIETVNVGAMLKFTMRLPPQYAMNTENSANLYVQGNRTVGFSDACDTEFQCSTTSDTCHVVIPYCALSKYCGARYYIWADAPRGTEIVVERYDPYVPILKHDISYHGSINQMDMVDFDLPWTPNSQIYRFDLDPKLYENENYYEKFYVRVKLFDVSQGEVSFTVNSGHSPYFSNAGCNEPMFLDTSSCMSVNGDNDCHIELQYSTLLALAGGDEHNIPHSFWINVYGVEQDCQLHAIRYSLVVQTHWAITYYPIDETICNTVQEDEYNFHRLRPREVEHPQASVLRIRISDLDVDESVDLLVQDHYLPTSLENTHFHHSSSESDDNTIDVNYICGYNDLYLSVYGNIASDDIIDYKMSVEKVPIRVKDLFVDSVYHADDDDDDACPHPHDFYRFRTLEEGRGHHPGSFMRVLVDSEFPTQVYVNKNDFAWEGCADSGYGENDPAITGTTSVNVYDFCNFADGEYFITVVSDGPYYIYTDVRDDAKELTLGQVFRDTVEPGMYQMYTLEICDDWTEADDRLVVEITDVENGDVYGWINIGGNAGHPDEYGYNTCSDAHAFADYGAAESGYDFLLVNHCDLQTGTYYILIRAAPHEGSPERNCEHVNFRLFPYLIDYQIDPEVIHPNTPITDAVDYYTVNRIIPDSVPYVQYYVVHPLADESQGYFEQISHAVARLSNVQGGLLHMKVMCDHLAVPEFTYINGEIYGLVANSADDADYDPSHYGLINPQWKMQSGRYPYIYNNIMDHRDSVYEPVGTCTGCADLCCTMTNDDDLDIYLRDKSCAIWVPSCYFVWKDFYIAVMPQVQYSQDHHIIYDLEVDQTRDYVLLQPNHNSVNSFDNDNWDYDFFYSISAEPESMRWRVVVTEGEGVLVTVRNHRCPRQATWTKSVWCDAAYFDRPWMCDIEIPTRAAHPGDNAYFISTYGKNATYSIAFWRGRENCHAFTGSGRNEGLDFCAGIVPYATWRWDHYSTLDHEASCFFDQLYQHFRVQPCYTGVTPECNSTLAAFACYESFHRCDEQGFYTGTCRDACEAVTYECANLFETVDLEKYDCTSNRYLDSSAQTCTGNPAFASLNNDGFFLRTQDPEVLLYDSSNSASTISFSFVLATILIVIALVF